VRLRSESERKVGVPPVQATKNVEPVTPTSSDLTLWFRREPDTRDIRESTTLGDPATKPIHQVTRRALWSEFSAVVVSPSWRSVSLK
jgi:hypothetical protein